MAPSKTLLLLLLAAAAVAVLLTPAARAADVTHGNCNKDKKVTVQNLCTHDVTLTLEPLASSPPLFPGASYTLRPRSHAEFPVCWWTGRLKSPGAVTVEFQVTADGGSFYLAPVAQQWQSVPVSVTPHGSPLQGHCPAVGCAIQGRCSAHQVPSGDCRNVQEIKIIYCNPHVL